MKAILAKKANTPSAANNLLKLISVLMKFALAMDWRKDDPTAGIKPMKTPEGGFYVWSEADVEKYEAAHPKGSMARLAMALMLSFHSRGMSIIRVSARASRHRKLSPATGASLDTAIPTSLSRREEWMAAGQKEKQSTARTVHIEEKPWKRIKRIALETDRTASDIVRVMIDNELPKFEQDMQELLDGDN